MQPPCLTDRFFRAPKAKTCLSLREEFDVTTKWDEIEIEKHRWPCFQEAMKPKFYYITTALRYKLSMNFKDKNVEK